MIVCVIGLALVQFRVSYSDLQKDEPLKVTTWDAFGYYIYLPATIIYDDVTDLEWLDEIEREYSVTGGNLYQANKHTNGNYVFKYLGGVAIMQSPFFLIGHAIAKLSRYPADGFSAPYQYSIAFGAIFYCILALFILRRILLRYFDDRTVAITLLFLTLASNLIQYVSVDGGQSHSYIFPLYAFILYTSIKWHESPKIRWAALTGLIIGLATICRPTELIMLFIPLLWGTQTKESKKEKWQLVKNHKTHIIYAVIFGVIGILPQLIYWKIASGSFVYDVGSKWFFFDPWFRVLFGFTNGWFIYTPITIFFVLGFFFMKKYPFQRSVILFCLFNIWIIIAWSDWHYGATYSTRALVQSYPVFSLALASIIQRIELSKLKYVFYVLGLYLTFVNFFQIHQYNQTVLHYRDMNRHYYSHIYLNKNPTPLDMSLLDTEEILNDEQGFKKHIVASFNTTLNINGTPDSSAIICTHDIGTDPKGWVKIKARIKMLQGYGSAYLHGKIESGSGFKESKIRIANPIADPLGTNDYVFYMKIPKCSGSTRVKISINASEDYSGKLEFYQIDHLKSN